MKHVKTLLILVGALAILASFSWRYWLADQVELARMGAAFTAKQVCSCRFVAERDEISCLTDFTFDARQFDIEIHALGDQQGVSSSVLGGLVKQRARYEPGLGCALTKS